MMMRFSPLICAALLAACASPTWQQPAVSLPTQWQASQAEQAAAVQSDQAFWASFADTQLLGLQSSASERNSDLALAAIRLRKAGFAVEQAGLKRLPDVNLGASANASWTLDPQRYRGETSGVSAGLSWEVDLWGKLADQQQAARWREQASSAELAAMKLTIASNVAASYWQIARDQEALALAQGDWQRARDTQQIIERRYRAGAVSGLDVTQARASTLQQQNIASQAQLTLAKSQWALGLLLDQPPQSTAATSAQLPTSYPVVPPGLPAQILDRRPDLAAATASLQASFADVQVNRKSWYPTLSLTGSLGAGSSGLANLLTNPIAALGSGIALPFIQYNEMALSRKSSEADYETAVITYRQKLYTALQEVENALANRTHLLNELPRAIAQAKENQLAEQQTELRYRAGAIAFDTVLNARARRQAADYALLQHRYQLALASVEVYKALGGAPTELK